jgi:hypothetical protein
MRVSFSCQVEAVLLTTPKAWTIKLVMVVNEYGGGAVS